MYGWNCKKSNSNHIQNPKVEEEAVGLVEDTPARDGGLRFRHRVHPEKTSLISSLGCIVFNAYLLWKCERYEGGGQEQDVCVRLRADHQSDQTVHAQALNFGRSPARVPGWTALYHYRYLTSSFSIPYTSPMSPPTLLPLTVSLHVP